MTGNKEILVIGAGAWGTALANQLARKNPVVVWDRNQSLIDTLNEKRVHPHFPNHPLLANLVFSHHLKPCSKVLIATSSSGFLEILQNKIWQESKTVASVAIATKGILTTPPYFLPKLMEQHHPNIIPVMISGPTFAKEVLACEPTGITVASSDKSEAKKWANDLKSGFFRPYLSNDPLGVSIFGALKNIYAIVCGVSSGMGYGANTQALLITRSLHEMTEFAQHYGAKEKTSLTLAGLGDLVLTAGDNLSRNRSFGVLLGQGNSPEKAAQKLGKLVEGVHSLKAVIELANQEGLSMPIALSLYQVIHEQKPIKLAITQLFSRAIKNG